MNSAVNVPKHLRKKGTLRTKLTVAFIPTPKIRKEDRSQPWVVDLQRAIFHYCYSVLLTPLQDICSRCVVSGSAKSVPFCNFPCVINSGMPMVGPFRKIYNVFPDLARFVADMPEQ